MGPPVEYEEDLGIVSVLFIALCVAALFHMWFRAIIRYFNEPPEDLPGRSEIEQIAASMRRDGRRTTDAAAPGSDDNNCAVCLEELRSPVEVLPCGHNFCAECVSRYWRTTGTYRRARCPLDRTVIECIVPAFRLREQMHQPTQSPADSIVWNYNRAFSGRGSTIRGIFAGIVNLVSNHRFLPVVVRLRIFALFLTLFLYFISPLDLIPESVLGLVGFVDDILVLIIVVYILSLIARNAFS